MTTSYTVNGSTRTDTGQERSRNEDAVGAFQPDDPELRELRGCLYVVADGMGGHAAGDVASSYAVQKILHDYYNLPWEGVEQTLLAAVKEANADIHDESNATAERSGMGCTTVAAAVTGNRAIIAHVGDSRAYLIRNGEIRQLTRDHSWVAEKLADGQITPEQAIDHPNRNVLTRNLGQLRTVWVDVTQEELQPGDRLLLCTDGLWNEVRDDQIAALAQRRNPEDATASLVDAANAAGGADNIGVALIGFGPLSSIGITRRVNAGLPAPSFGPSTTTARTRRVAARPTAERRWLVYLVPWLFALVGGFLIGLLVHNALDTGKSSVSSARTSPAPSTTKAAASTVPPIASCSGGTRLDEIRCQAAAVSSAIASATASAAASTAAIANSASTAPAPARTGSPTRTATAFPTASQGLPSAQTKPTAPVQDYPPPPQSRQVPTCLDPKNPPKAEDLQPAPPPGYVPWCFGDSGGLLDIAIFCGPSTAIERAAYLQHISEWTPWAPTGGANGIWQARTLLWLLANETRVRCGGNAQSREQTVPQRRNRGKA